MSGRGTASRGSKAAVLLLALVMMGSALLAATQAANAVVGDGSFELGPGPGVGAVTDILGDPNIPGPDWGDLFDATGKLVYPGAIAVFLKDDLSQGGNVDRTTYSGAGGSNKNNDPISDWHWATGNVPAKDDLSNVYAYAVIYQGHLILYVGFERITASGDSHIDVEFFKESVGLDRTPPCDVSACDWVGTRSVGDIIVSMDFLTGGGFGTMTVREWDGTTYQLVEAITGEGCNAEDTICGFNNDAPIPGGSWPSYDRHGHTITTLPTNAFTEFGIDITSLEGTTPCLTSVLGKTRSSQSFTAELKDFAGPAGFPLCSAAIAIGPDAVNEVGQEHTFTVSVDQTVAGVTSPAPDGTIVTVDLTAANGAAVDFLDDQCASPGTSGGECTVTFSSDSAGTITGHASATVHILNQDFFVQTDGTGANSGDAVKRYVDAKISIAPDATNRVGETHTFVVTVLVDEGLGAGFVNAPDDTLVTVTLTPANGAAVAGLVDTCASPGLSSGTCSVSFTSASAGTVTGHASVSLTFDTVVVNRETNGVLPNSGDAVKTFVDARISISPDKVNEVGTTHVFTVTVEMNAGDGNGWVDGPDDTLVTVILTPSNGASIANKVDTCASPGLSSGTCSVSFTSPTAGIITGHASAEVAVASLTIGVATDGTGQNSGDATKRFVDAYILISPSDDENSIEEMHTFTVTVQQNLGDGAGWVNAPDGTLVTVTLEANGATIVDVVDTCASPGLSSGTCSVSFTSTTAGTVTGHASVILKFDTTVVVTRETDGKGQNSGDAVKTFVAGSIAWTKKDNAGRLQGGATFEVCRIADWDSDTMSFVSITPDCVEVTDNSAPDMDPVAGQFLLVNLVLGRYTVHETVAPDGYAPDPKTETVELSLANPDETIAVAFVNQRPILKLTTFGYTNTPTGVPTDGVVSGTTVYSFSVKNFGGADALLSLTFIVSVPNGAGSGTVKYSGSTGSAPDSQPGPGDDCVASGCTVSWTDVPVSAGGSVAFTVTIVYDSVADGKEIRADLGASYTVVPNDGFERDVSGTPAAIIFTIQAD